MSWFHLSLRASLRNPSPFPSPKLGEGRVGGEVAKSVVPRNEDITDPGISLFTKAQDEYVSPHPSLSPLGERVRERGPIRWVRQLLEKKQALETARGVVAKIELLSRSPDNAIRYFFDNDLLALVSISQKYPQQVQQILNESLENSPTRKISEPWYRLVQVACGDNSAILPALDGLC